MDDKETSTSHDSGPVLREVDNLQYRGNNVPRVIRLAWTVLIVFSLYYLWRFMMPDLLEWMK